MLGVSVLAGDALRSHYYPDGIGLHSVKVMLYRDLVFYDSIPPDSIDVFPFSGDITIDDRNQWRIEYRRFWGPTGADSTISDEIVWGTAGALSPATPPGANFCTVYGKFYDNQNNPIIGAQILFDPAIVKVRDTCTEVTIIPGPRTVETNDTGYFSISLLKSSCMGNTAYKVSVSVINEYGTLERKEETLTIPADSSTYLLKF